MHYANNREVKVGDPVVGLTNNQKGATGFVAGVVPEADRCNLLIATLCFYPRSEPNGVWIGGIAGLAQDGATMALQQLCGTASEFLHAEDAAEAWNSADDGKLEAATTVGPACIVN